MAFSDILLFSTCEPKHLNVLVEVSGNQVDIQKYVYFWQEYHQTFKLLRDRIAKCAHHILVRNVVNI